MLIGPTRVDLRALRLNRGHSPRSLGRELHLSPQTIERAEAGERVTAGTAHVLATFYELQVTDVWNVEQPQGQAA
jgi:transcriptional regulator with XRE-family HTH domain